jgi:hypothetical protein
MATRAIQQQQEQAAAEQMLRMITGFWLSRAVAAAATLGIADHLTGKPRSIEDLAELTSTDPDSLYRLLRALSSNGVFLELENKRFAATPLSATLRSDSPASLRSFAMSEVGGCHYRAWGSIEDAVRTGRTSFDTVFGTDAWTWYRANQEEFAVFNDSMTRVTEVVVAGVLDVYDFSGYRKVVDVGGGHGRMLASILGANPAARGVLMDQPGVVEEARALLSGGSLDGRVEFAPGDFFESVPEGGDLYTMKWIIHDWEDERSIRILRNIRKAMVPHGRVLLVETVLNGRNEPGFGPLMDLNMLVMTGGRERTAGEFDALFREAGLRLRTITPTPTPMSVIEAVQG